MKHIKGRNPATKIFHKIQIYGDDSGSLANSFHTLGRLPHDRILEILQKADALVMASRWPENAHGNRRSS